MSKDYYEILGISKTASDAEIKKAYRKKAMEWHPDKNKWDKNAEDKFKSINEAYQTLWDAQKRKQYDTFWGSSGNFDFWGQGFPWGGWFEDLFKNAGGSRYQSSRNFDFWDLFWEMFSWSKKKTSWNYNENFGNNKQSDFNNPQPKKEVKPILDVENTYEVPIMDLILWTKLNITTVYNENLKLNVPEWTKPWTKFKIKWKWRSSDGKTWDMYVTVEAKMPKNIPEDLRKLLESIKYRL